MYNSKLHFYLTGIGGSGMSGIAELLIHMGFQVSGSDLVFGKTCLRLQQLGATIFQGHAAEHLPQNASLLVYSSAVSEDNPELVEARRRGLPVIQRAEVLAELIRLKYGVVVAGSHGKTTTTSMIGAIFERAGLDPTVFIGGQFQGSETGSRLGAGEHLVAESDESDRSFLLFQPTVAILTNIDQEHMAAYASYEELIRSFAQFMESVPFYGLAIFCVDDPEVLRMSQQFSKRKVLYGFGPEAEVTATNIRVKQLSSEFDVSCGGKEDFRVTLPLPGKHMVQNALAAIAVAREFGIAPEVIQQALSNFGGVKRRLETLVSDSDIEIMTDYGHHPTEVCATLDALRNGFPERRLRVVFEPHRYTRTRDCYDAFCQSFSCCDELYVTDIYAASEKPIIGLSGEKLAQDIEHPSVSYVESFDLVTDLLLSSMQPGDIILCLGAGSIGAFAERFASAYMASIDKRAAASNG